MNPNANKPVMCSHSQLSIIPTSHVYSAAAFGTKNLFASQGCLS